MTQSFPFSLSAASSGQSVCVSSLVKQNKSVTEDFSAFQLHYTDTTVDNLYI